jgi:hypothetical protein
MKYSWRYLAHLKEMEQKKIKRLTHVEHKMKNTVDRRVWEVTCTDNQASAPHLCHVRCIRMVYENNTLIKN